MKIQYSATIKDGFACIRDYELQVDVTGSKEGYTVEDQHTGTVLVRNVSLRVAHHIATQYRQTHR